MDQDQVKMMLPLTFSTTITSISDIGFEIEVNCEAKDFETWLKEFENITKTNYTIRKKSSNGQLYERTLYATCHHNTYGKFHTKENFKYGSKNTQCPVKIQMKKARPLLIGLSTSTLISVHFNHNHPILAADSLRFRKPCKAIEEKFLKLFESGHTPASSIQAHNLDIILENPDDYEVLLSDNRLSPNYQWVSRLHRKLADSTYGSKKLTTSEQAQLIKKLASEKDCLCEIVEVGEQQETCSTKLEICTSESDLGKLSNSDVLNNESAQSLTDQHSTLFGNICVDNVDISIETREQENLKAQMTTIEAEENLKNIFNDLLSKSKEMPDVYLPAIEAFSKKYNATKTDANLISSLYCFGKGLNESTTSTNVYYAVKRRGKKVRIQPTSASRRRIPHLGKGTSSSVNVGRPHKPKELRERRKYVRSHQLTKALHSLSSCVAKDISGR